MKKFGFKGFTLAEVMIVLTVIGIISAIIMPIAFQTMPDENVLKFKKANSTLYQVIQELVNSDKYYKDGDLGIKTDGTMIDGTHTGDYSYFCRTFVDILSVKKYVCSEKNTNAAEEYSFVQGGGWPTNNSCTEEGYQTVVSYAKKTLDAKCAEIASMTDGEIFLADGTVFYEGDPARPFGIEWGKSQTLANGQEGCNSSAIQLERCNSVDRLFGGHIDCYGFDRIYKIFCLDVDGKNKGEDPFGYGIRADGKILTSKRADEWLEKDIQGEN